MSSYVVLLQLLFIIVLLWPDVATSTLPLAKPNCSAKCGDILVPYPFGFGSKKCYRNTVLDDFKLICSNNYNPPKLIAGENVEVLNISFQGQVTILSPISNDCFNKLGERINRQQTYMTTDNVNLFTVSDTENKFTALGCDTISKINGFNGRNFQSGCSMICSNVSDVINGSCTGIGCCQTSIPKGFGSFNVSLDSYENHTHVFDFNPCSYAFVVQSSWFNFSLSDLFNFTSIDGCVPVVYDWAVDLKSCEEAMKDLTTYACKNSECVTSKNGFGYNCVCSKGYEGNPYLHDGCQDVDECKLHTNNCSKNAMCKNTRGSYNCYCPKGFYGDGFENGTRCVEKVSLPVTKIIAGVIVCIIALPIFIWLVYWAIKKRRLIKLKEKFFQQNGGLLLQQQIALYKGVQDIAKIFTIERLKMATNNFHESQIIGQGGYGTVYKGILPSGKVVAIKKSKTVDKGQIIQFINEVDILSQINHRHVVKLLGCCLETEVPLLVYEFVSNGTLYQHIHSENKTFLSWENRLRIAAETADALAYLHSSHSVPIFHRDVKSSNILLDDKYNARVSDFGASRLVPLDQTQKTTRLQGTHGYLDPDCLPTGQLTDKSDVYSFGVVLVELLTRKKPIFMDESGDWIALAMYFVSTLKDGNLLHILDDQIVDGIDGNRQQVLIDVAEIARSCLEERREDRPAMKEVAKDLDSLKMMNEQPLTQHIQDETDFSLGGPSTSSTDPAFDMGLVNSFTDDDDICVYGR